MDYQDALSYINSLTSLGWQPGLERSTALCERLGSPHERIRAVHIGGTNGKGSTAAMVSSVLQSAGYRVGLYLSPYVYDVRERVQINGEMISEHDFARLVSVIRPHAEALASIGLGQPTEFEVKTALGLLYFAEQEVDFVALEVGGGGRLDATNIVVPLVSVITSVSLDHTDRLGNTIPEIAFEKAGIVKPGGHLVTAVSDAAAMAVIRRVCEEKESVLWHVRPAGASGVRFAVTEVGPCDPPPTSEVAGQYGKASGLAVKGLLRDYEGLEVGLRGQFQFTNAATAVGTIEALRAKGVQVPESAIRYGLESAYLPGRLEVLRTDPTLVLDGAHNLDAVEKLARALQTEFEYNRMILVMGMVEGHSVEHVVGTLAPLADTLIATAPRGPRAASAASIAEAARGHKAHVLQAKSVSEAVRKALNQAAPQDLVCVTGSFYVVGEVPRDMGRLSAEV